MTKLSRLCVAFVSLAVHFPEADDPHSPTSVPWPRVCDLCAHSHVDSLPSSSPPLSLPSGSIPGWRRDLHGNNFDGSLPPEYSTMTKLWELCVAYAAAPDAVPFSRRWPLFTAVRPMAPCV